MRARSNTHTSRLLLLTSALVLASCSPDSGPVAPNAESALLKGGVTATIGRASPAWQSLAVTASSQAAFNPIVFGRALPLLGVAQYRAVQRAEAALNHDAGND
ncbi:MAG TPA: hypothetical protein VE861_13865, partial [Gemmatimonadaceae bacterium]|nr:hypothetical protein [Gemmatimonadaceae bacterium]